MYSSLPLCGACARADEGRQRRRPAGAAGGRPNGGRSIRPARDAQRRDPARRLLDARARRRRTHAARRRTPRRSPTSARSTPARARSRIPILNEAGISQISPSNTYNGPDRRSAARRGEPGKYYPTGRRTFFRIVPNDPCRPPRLPPRCATAAARGSPPCTTARSTARGMNTLRHAAAQPSRPAGRRTIARSAARTRGFARDPRARPDCIVYTGLTANGAVRLFRSVGRGCAASAVRVRRRGRDRLHAPPAAARSRGARSSRVATLAPDAYPGGAIIGRSDPYKLYGYEAMKLILDALNAGGPTKAGVLGCLRGVQNRESVLGTYASTPTATRRCAPTGSTPSAAAPRLGREPFTAALSSSEAVELELEPRSASTRAIRPGAAARRSPRSRTATNTSPPRMNATASGPASTGS